MKKIFLFFKTAVVLHSSILLLLLLTNCKKECKNCDSTNQNLIIDDRGNVTTFAGSGSAANTNGTGTTASFNSPDAIAIDDSGNIYVADCYNHMVRKITPSGIVTTLAGSSSPGRADGVGTAASFYYPRGIALDKDGTIYVADYGNYIIRKITKTGIVSTFAGSGTRANVDGIGNTASFSGPIGIIVDKSGSVFVSDMDYSKIRKITPSGEVTTIAGLSGEGYKNGTGAVAIFSAPQGLALDTVGNLYIADNGNHVIRKITPDGIVSTFAGSGVKGSADGSLELATFSKPRDVIIDYAGNLYVADLGNNNIRKITTSGTVTTLAGNGTAGNNNGIGTKASFYWPTGVAVDSSGNIYVTDELNNLIRKITP